MQGRYLNANFSLRNQGLKYSDRTKIIIYADEKEIKEIEIDPLDIGYGTKYSLSNIWIGQINIDKIKFVIKSDFDELDKTNNEVEFVVEN